VSPAARSIQVFGWYFLGFGLGMAAIPNTLLPIFGFETTNEPWIRILGLVVIAIGYYYLQSARHEQRAFFQATVFGRTGTFLGLIALVVFGFAKPMVIALGAVEMIGTVWTWKTLQKK
jgi:hypothetical protein